MKTFKDLICSITFEYACLFHLFTAFFYRLFNLNPHDKHFPDCLRFSLFLRTNLPLKMQILVLILISFIGNKCFYQKLFKFFINRNNMPVFINNIFNI